MSISERIVFADASDAKRLTWKASRQTVMVG